MLLQRTADPEHLRCMARPPWRIASQRGAQDEIERALGRRGSGHCERASQIGLGWPLTNIRKIFFEELPRALSGRSACFDPAQFGPPNLPRDGLGQVRELQAPNALVRRQAAPREDENLSRQLCAGRVSGRQYDKRFGNRRPQRVGAGNHSGFGNGRMLDQCALQLKRADAVVRCLKIIRISLFVHANMPIFS
jgi:hypothetical protein